MHTWRQRHKHKQMRMHKGGRKHRQAETQTKDKRQAGVPRASWEERTSPPPQNTGSFETLSRKWFAVQIFSDNPSSHLFHNVCARIFEPPRTHKEVISQKNKIEPMGQQNKICFKKSDLWLIPLLPHPYNYLHE